MKSMTRNLMVLALAIGTLLPSTVMGQRLGLFRSRKKQETPTYQLTEKSGPVLIMCASFDGTNAEQDAVRLADELRLKYKQKVYIYKREFDLSREVSDKGHGYAKPSAPGVKNVRKVEMKLLNNDGRRHEFAVLIGDFADIDSKKAQRTLEAVKSLKPESLNQYSEDVTDSSLSGQRLRATSDAMFGNRSSSWTELNNQAEGSDQPLRFAFLLNNPVLPEEYYASQKIDQHVLKLNKGYENNLLNNPKTYTVKVATFAGRTVVNDKQMAELRNRKGSDELVKSAKKAHILTTYLRKKGFEAYEFHDRFESYVCVGSFDWIKREVNGSIVPNPEVAKVIQTFKGRPAGGGKYVTGFPLPGKLIKAEITCDSSPISVMVPKVNIGR